MTAVTPTLNTAPSAPLAELSGWPCNPPPCMMRLPTAATSNLQTRSVWRTFGWAAAHHYNQTAYAKKGLFQTFSSASAGL